MRNVQPVVRPLVEVHIHLAGEQVQSREFVPGVPRTGDREDVFQDLRPAVSLVDEQLVERLACVGELPGLGVGQHLPDALVDADRRERLVGGVHRDLAFPLVGRLSSQNRLPEVAACGPGDVLQALLLVGSALGLGDVPEDRDNLVVGWSPDGNRETPRPDRRDERRGLAGRDDELRRLVVLLHDPPERLLEVLAHPLGVVQQDRLVLALHGRVAR